MNDKSYRKNVGLIVLDKNNRVLVCRRKGKKTWQFPQGGIDAGESHIKAAYRELYEEVGIKKNQVKIIQKSKHWYHYDLPEKPDLQKCLEPHRLKLWSDAPPTPCDKQLDPTQ